MREIKFRAWDNNEKKWLLGYEYPNLGGFSMFGETMLFEEWSNVINRFILQQKDRKPDDLILMQFTGLKDKNGTEIYEGDILAYKSAHPKHDGKVFNNVVEFATGQSLCGWRMRNKSCVVKATPYKFSCSEVIGNIYENPELLQTIS